MRKIALLLVLCMGLGLASCQTAGNEENNSDFEETVQMEDTVDTGVSVTDSFSPSATIVNKDGTKGAVTYVIDDYFKSEAAFAELMLDTYDNLTFSFAVKTQDVATLKTQTGSDGKLEYVMDANGKYTYTVNEQNRALLQDILDYAPGRTEIISHSHTHDFWGTNDDGGVFEYYKNDGVLHTSIEMPKGSATKELYAAKQIISDLFPSQRSISFVEPGIGVKTVDVTDSGKTVVTFKKYFNELLSGMIESGDCIGSRGTFQAAGGFDKYVNSRFSLATLEGRMNVSAFMILDKNSGDGIENWTNYIDEALKRSGWACFCIHKMTKSVDNVYHYILQSEAKQLFKYTQELGDDVWVAPFTDAMLYFSEWSTASVSAEYKDGKISVKLTDKENDSVYNMPLTVKVTVPDTWSTARVGGTELTVHREENKKPYVYVDIIPDASPVELSKG